MMPFFFRFASGLLLAILLVTNFACRSDHAHEAKAASEASDTRALVKAAFAKIDPMTIGVARTADRVRMMEQGLATERDPGRRINMQLQYGADLLKLGRTEESARVLEDALSFIEANHVEMDSVERRSLQAAVAVAYLRQGEIENCLQFHNHESCFIPIRQGGLHRLPEGSRKAIEWYQRILKRYPGDLESRYLLNLAYMTLGEYPERVPTPFLVPPAWYQNEVQGPVFTDIAGRLGVDYFSLAGGVILDDFTNDGWLDIVVTSWGIDEELKFYLNNGDGSFSDATERFGLKGYTGVLHLNQTDINNDGWLDILLLRGAWYFGPNGEIPKTLLLNTGNGGFEDITLKAGLGKAAPSQAASWADVNLDGWLDLVVANESIEGFPKGVDLYINRKDNTFQHASAEYGLNQDAYFKAALLFDADNDRYPDLYMSAVKTPNVFLRNTGPTGRMAFMPPPGPPVMPDPVQSFPAFYFDYDNDGDEDVFVSGFSNDRDPCSHWMLDHMGRTNRDMLPRLYRNDGQLKFTEVGQAAGLNEVVFTMGCNFGDIDVDGYLDFYLGTGNPLYQSLVPNKMYLNQGGRRFADVSYSSGVSNIQKGHGVSFGDLDHDGDEDLYCSIGGAYEGDGFFNCLFENPNTDKNNWIVLNLKGTTANGPAIGARVRIRAMENGRERSIYRTVTSGASFGANSLALEVGLGKATEVLDAEVTWPCRDCPRETFTGLVINSAYLLEQGTGSPKTLPYTSAQFKAPPEGVMHPHH